MYKLKPDTRGWSILSLDPGSSNFGISCSALIDGQPVLKANGLLQNPIKQLKSDLAGQRKRFLQEIDYWITSFGCKAIVAERYQARGIRGNSGELISLMMGIILQRYRKLDVQLITAAQWKNDWHRQYDFNLKDVYKACRTTPHQLDATLIGLYGLQQLEGRKFDYNVQGLLDGVAAVSLGKLFNRKNVL